MTKHGAAAAPAQVRCAGADDSVTVTDGGADVGAVGVAAPRHTPQGPRRRSTGGAAAAPAAGVSPPPPMLDPDVNSEEPHGPVQPGSGPAAAALDDTEQHPPTSGAAVPAVPAVQAIGHSGTVVPGQGVPVLPHSAAAHEPPACTQETVADAPEAPAATEGAPAAGAARINTPVLLAAAPAAGAAAPCATALPRPGSRLPAPPELAKLTRKQIDVNGDMARGVLAALLLGKRVRTLRRQIPSLSASRISPWTATGPVCVCAAPPVVDHTLASMPPSSASGQRATAAYLTAHTLFVVGHVSLNRRMWSCFRRGA